MLSANVDWFNEHYQNTDEKKDTATSERACEKDERNIYNVHAKEEEAKTESEKKRAQHSHRIDSIKFWKQYSFNWHS